MIRVGDTVEIGSRLGADPAKAVVLDILPGSGDRLTLFRIRFSVPTNRDGRRAELDGNILMADPNPQECWVDESNVFGPFLDQDIGWEI